jgi:hypothetical protein
MLVVTALLVVSANTASAPDQLVTLTLPLFQAVYVCLVICTKASGNIAYLQDPVLFFIVLSHILQNSPHTSHAGRRLTAQVVLCLPADCRDVVGVQQLANAVDRSQMIVLRANFISKCAHPELQVRHALPAAWLVCHRMPLHGMHATMFLDMLQRTFLVAYLRTRGACCTATAAGGPKIDMTPCIGTTLGISCTSIFLITLAQ